VSSRSPEEEGWGTHRTRDRGRAAPAGLHSSRQHLDQPEPPAEGKEGQRGCCWQRSEMLLPSHALLPWEGGWGAWGYWIAAGTPVPDPPEGILEPPPTPRASGSAGLSGLAATFSSTKPYRPSISTTNPVSGLRDFCF